MALPFFVALAQNPQQGGLQGMLVSLLPFGLMLAIFYLLVLMPMRKRQKKIDEFRSAIKVGDKVITTGGIHGQVTKVSDAVVQLQIAANVKIDVARASIGGYQGQEPVVPQDAGGM